MWRFVMIDGMLIEKGFFAENSPEQWHPFMHVSVESTIVFLKLLNSYHSYHGYGRAVEYPKKTTELCPQKLFSFGRIIIKHAYLDPGVQRADLPFVQNSKRCFHLLFCCFAALLSRNSLICTFLCVHVTVRFMLMFFCSLHWNVSVFLCVCASVQS